MRSIFLAGFCLLQIMVFVDVGWAASGHAKPMGVQEEQICADPIVDIVGKFLGVHAFKIPADGYAANDEAIIVAAACKANPDDKRVTIAAIAYVSETENIKKFIVAFVDERERKVLSIRQDDIEEDAGMKVVSSSLRIDTAPYRLTDTVRAFGVDVSSGSTPRCVDGGFGAERTLYVQEGKLLRPVLTTTMSEWQYIKGGSCLAQPAPTVIENVSLSIGLGSGVTNGYRDLVITAKRSRDDRKPAKQGKFHYTLHYDGGYYPTQGMTDQLSIWRN